MKKKRLSILLLSLMTFLCIHAQHVITQKEIEGRWVGGTELQSDSSIVEDQYTYIFRENNVFHIGETFEGVILFNITGKYYVENNTIYATYLDMLEGKQTKYQPNNVSFRIISIQQERMTLLINDLNYEYKLYLKKLSF